MSCYTSYVEKEQSEGRLDCAIETADSVFIFEFKRDGSAEKAIAQIDEKGYAIEFLSSGKKIYKIGLSISSATGRIDDWMAVEAN